tara:strand:- start:216 stop:428 length:213 start_codon:yes stop_codon:yes gene_type:complete
LLNDATFFHDNDIVCLTNCGQPVGDDENGALGDQMIECLLDFSLGDGVDTGSGFIEYHKGRVFQEYTGDG